MVIQHNLSAMNSHRQLGINNSSTSKNLEKLSSGFKVNRAGDDAAGLAISEKMRGQIRGLTMANQNAQNGVSLIQTAEGGLNETHSILQRMRELAVQSANGTYMDDVDRESIAKEVEALKSEIDRIASATHYNGIKLLDGSLGAIAGDALDAAAVYASLGLNPLGSLVLGTSQEFIQKYGTEFNYKEAILIVSKAEGSTIGSITLQIGDKIFAREINLNGAYCDFKDADGVTVASIGHGMFLPGYVQCNGVVKVTLAYNGGRVSALGEETSVIANSNSKLIFQIGANGTADQRVGLHVDNMSTAFLGYESGKAIYDIKADTRENANDAIKTIDTAINQVSGTRADLGALQNRLEHTINNLGTTTENLQAAESTIRDVDMAKEMMEFTKNNILVQASQSMLAQANQLPQGVLQLLK